MSVYVDDMQAKFRQMKMSHMIADTLDELHEMAEAIGLKRRWFQPKSFPHYDISQSKKLLAVRAGAIQVSPDQFVKVMKTYREANKKVGL